MISRDPVDKLLKKIERTARALDRAPKQVAKDVLGDGKAYQRLLDGWRGISFDRVENADTKLDGLLAAASKKKPSGSGLAA